MALLYLLDFATPLAFSVSVPSLITTVVLFACIYGATLLYNMVHIRLANPVELLHGGQKGEKEPKPPGFSPLRAWLRWQAAILSPYISKAR